MNTHEMLQELLSRIEVLTVKVTMLERVVYGAVGVVLMAVATAGMAFLLRNP